MQKRLLKFSIFLALLLVFITGLLIHEKNILKKEEGNSAIRKMLIYSNKKGKVSANIPMIKVDEDTIYFPEFEFYILATKKDCENVIGKKVWNMTDRGRKIGELAVADVVDEIVKLKIINKEAENEGYEVSSKESEEIEKTAKNQVAGIDSLIKARYYLDEKLISTVYQENFLATKFFEGYSQKNQLTEDEAKEEFNRKYIGWRGKHQVQIYWENINKNTDITNTCP